MIDPLAILRVECFAMSIDIDGKTYSVELLAIALRYAAFDPGDPETRALLLIAASALNEASRAQA